jgi:hypothetical protein
MLTYAQELEKVGAVEGRMRVSPDIYVPPIQPLKVTTRRKRKPALLIKYLYILKTHTKI